jgi:UDP-N-acetylglucosamine transferase subunit ALG13
MLIQRGTSTTCPRGARSVDFLPFDELMNHIRAARVVVTHAGVGSILAVNSVGKRPIVVPRLRRFGEAVDDHQLSFARRLDRAGLIVLVEDLRELPAVIARTSAIAQAPNTSGALVTEIRRFLRDATSGHEELSDDAV